MEEIKEKNLDPHNFFKKNLGAEDRVDAKAYEEMNLPMTGVPEEDNITILDDKPPLFHNVPEYDIENNPFSFLYVDMTYDCNMECEFCYNPVRNYSTLDINGLKMYVLGYRTQLTLDCWAVNQHCILI